jgi:hypothetical protein
MDCCEGDTPCYHLTCQQMPGCSMPSVLALLIDLPALLQSAAANEPAVFMIADYPSVFSNALKRPPRTC